MFSIGIRWTYNEFKKHEPHYVAARYPTWKEEILNYKHLDIDQFNQVLNKSQEYIKTAVAKSMKSLDDLIDEPLNKNHLVAIILYCDYSELCTDFRQSFRKMHQFETLDQIKKRNSNYRHWSQCLRQTVYCFGQRKDDKNGMLPKLNGPFYCGMDMVLNISQFNMYFCAPTSTSIQLTVATKFSGDEGMILEMDNSVGDGRFFLGIDVSWISRFREEDERYAFSVCIFM